MNDSVGQVDMAPNSARAFLTLFPAIILPIFLAMLDQTITTTALPSIADQFGNAQRIALVMISYLIAVAITAPVYGRFGDAFGRKRMLFVSLFVFCLASIFCALSRSMTELILARLLQGLGGGGLLALSQALIGETLSPRDRAKYQGYLATAAVTANAIGPVAGGYISEYMGWQWIFLVNVPLGVIAFWLLSRLRTQHQGSERLRLDIQGLILLIVFVTSTLLIPQFHYDNPLKSLLFRGLLVAIATGSAAFLWSVERRASFPVISIELVSRPAAWRSLGLAACHGATLLSLLTFLPIYMRVVRGSTVSEAGSLLLPFTVGIGIGSFVTGRLVSRTGLTTIFPSIGLLFAIGSVLLLVWFAGSITDLWLTILLAVTAISLGTVMTVVQVTMQTEAGRSALGSAAGAVQLSRSIGAAVGTALVSAMLFFAARYFGPDVWHALIQSIEFGPKAVTSLSDDGFHIEKTQLTDCFRIAFATIAVFSTTAFLLVNTIPTRQLSSND